jgi:hypothetical protein
VNDYLHSALKLHGYLTSQHWNGQGLMGPDPGIRLNYRVGRFVKSYLPNLHWNDDLYYLQAQGYWVLGNWRLFARTGEGIYREIALRCSHMMLQRQRDDGAWDYPNPEWKGRVATAEGTWGALGLLESCRQTTDPVFLRGALRWYEYLTERIGFQHFDDELAVNYFANRGGDRVPNNSAIVLRFLAELADVTGDETYLQPCTGLLTFMEHVQKVAGEFPYAVGGAAGDKGQAHFQCYQYNAFQCLDLTRYYEVTENVATLPLITKVLKFLSGGLAEDGYAFYACGNRHRTVNYHTAVLAAAFAKADHIGIPGYKNLAASAYAYLLDQQRPNGSFYHSQRDYFILNDQRPYPRYLAMILYHLQLSDYLLENGAMWKEPVHLVLH